MTSLLLYYEWLAVILVGLILGSFATAVTHREMTGQSWGLSFRRKTKANYRSSCPKCKKTLNPLDMIPLLSWLLLGGKCSKCNNKISILYPATELLSVLACLGIYSVYGLTADAIIMMLAIPFLIALIIIDSKILILPNSLVLALAILALINAAWNGYGENHIVESLAKALMSGTVYALMLLIAGLTTKAVLKKETLGMGDIKFFGVAGLWLGLWPMPDFFVLSGLLGILFSAAWHIVKKQMLFPFGPAMIISLYSLWLSKGSIFSNFIIQ